MLSEEILKEITVADLPHGDIKTVAETCGIDVALRLLQFMAGTSIYVNKNALQPFLTKFILSNAKKYNPKELAIKTGMSEQWVYNVLKKNHQGPETLQMF